MNNRDFKMKYVGAHVSMAGGIENAPARAGAIGAKAFALFTKNQRRWEAPKLRDAQAEKFKENCIQYEFDLDHILVHDSYLINLGHPGRKGLEKSRKAFIEELKRCERIGVKKCNFHPGSHLNGITVDSCLERVAESINMAHAQTTEAITVIENTAGQGTNVGYSFEQLARIIHHVENKERVGVCLDTCHLFCSPSGYDIRTPETYEVTMKAFDRIIGVKYLKGAHVNDSRKDYQQRIDRHEQIGRGEIGLSAFRSIMNDKRFDNIPLILETPDQDEWAGEIRLLYSFQNL